LKYINFSATNYAAVFVNNGVASNSGWVAGGSLTYGFSITTGTINAGEFGYIGGSGLSNSLKILRAINTSSTSGDRFGNPNSSGVLGNGGSNADGVALFDVNINSLISSTVPIDAIFFGSDIGDARVSNSNGYQLPNNDVYSGGKLKSNSYYIPLNAVQNKIYVASGQIDPSASNVFINTRSWTLEDTTNIQIL
jgi:hypothetical protein